MAKYGERLVISQALSASNRSFLPTLMQGRKKTKALRLLSLLLFCLLHVQCDAGSIVTYDDRDLKNLHISSSYLKEVIEEIKGGDDSRINTKNDMGEAPMHLALEESSHKVEDIMEFLLKKGANIDVADGEGNTPLMLAIKKPLFSRKKKEIIEFLVKRGADVNKANKDGYTAFTLALKAGLIDEDNGESILKLLTKKGVDIDEVDAEGNTPLLSATKDGIKGAVKLLVKTGADVNKVDEEGNTPLMLAAKVKRPDSKWEETIKILSKSGSKSLNAYNKEGDTALTLAIKNKKYGGIGDKAIIKELIKGGVDVNKVDGNGNSPLALAIKKGYFSEDTNEVIKTMVNVGKADLAQTDEEGNTPLMLLSQYDPCYNNKERRELAQLFLKNTAALNAQNNRGETPLIILLKKSEGAVCSVNNTEEASELLRVLANEATNFLLKDNEGNHPLHWVTKMTEPLRTTT